MSGWDPAQIIGVTIGVGVALWQTIVPMVKVHLIVRRVK